MERNVEFCNTITAQKDRLLLDLTAYRKQIEDYTKALRDLYMDKVKGILSEEQFIALSKNFSGNRERLEHLISTSETQLMELDERIAAGDNRRELIERYTNLEHLTREMVEILIDYISIGKRISGTKKVPIVIHWNF